jgi:hypothetical protein
MKVTAALATIIALAAALPQGGQAPSPTERQSAIPTPPAAFQAVPSCGANLLNPIIEESGCQFTGELSIEPCLSSRQ